MLSVELANGSTAELRRCDIGRAVLGRLGQNAMGDGLRLVGPAIKQSDERLVGEPYLLALVFF